MAKFETYKDKFPHARLTRAENGVLEVVLHTDGGTLIFDGYAHEEFVDLFHQIGQDADNRAVILTGAGDAFIDKIEPAGFDFFTPRGFDKIYRVRVQKVLANSAGHSGAGDCRPERPDDGSLGICPTIRHRHCRMPEAPSSRTSRILHSASCQATAFILCGRKSSGPSGVGIFC